MIYAGTVATLAAAFAEALADFVPLAPADKLAVALAVDARAPRAVNYYGVRHGARCNNVTATARSAALVALRGGGAVRRRGSACAPAARCGRRARRGISLAAFGLALSPVLFTYLGWNAAVYVASEIRDPARNVPRSLFVGLAICTAIYLAGERRLPLRAPARDDARRAERGRGGGARALRRARSGAWSRVLRAACRSSAP